MTIVPPLLLAARLLLAGVFLLSGVSKLLDRSGSRQAMIDFGLPVGLAAAFAFGLSFAELLVAVVLIPTASAVYGAIGALVLVFGFVIGIVANLARGRRPDCHCFGQLYSEPIGWKTLARNGVFGALALFILVFGWSDPGPSVVAWMGSLSVFERAVVLGGALGLALLGAQCALLTKLVLQNRSPIHSLAASAPTTATPAGEAPSAPSMAMATLRTAGRPVGSVAPAFMLANIDGDTIALDELRGAGKPVFLLFSDPACNPCNLLLPHIGEWQRTHAGAFTLALVTRGTPEANHEKVDPHGVTRVLLQRDREVAEAYAVFGTPSAVLVRPDGTIGSPLAQGETEIRQLVAQAVESQARVDQPALSVAPSFALPDLDGRSVTLAQFRDQPTLVLFWNPGCGHCQRMLPDLKAWEGRPAAERAQLLVVSTGTVEANRAMGLRSTIVLDPGFTVGPQYGVQGTPSAVLVDADGRLDSPVRVGGSAVLALAGQPESPYNATMNAGMAQTIGGVREAPPETLPPDAKPLKAECVQDELLSDQSIVLYNGCRQHALTLNATGALVWEYCDGEHDVEAIAKELRHVFPAASNPEQDVRALLDGLLQAGMIGSSPTSAATPSPVTFFATTP